MDIQVGVSACVLGHPVRFDGGHKRHRFTVEELSEFFNFTPLCPEVSIGLTVPRPTIRLVKKGEHTELVATKDPSIIYTENMNRFCDKHIPTLEDMCGYIVCAKSPTCGMERVKLYRENGHTIPGGTMGMFTQKLIDNMPWLPVEEDGRLQDPVLRENFIFRVFALNDLYNSVSENLSIKSIVDFHSRYKLTLMAHSRVDYTALGSLVANIKGRDLDEFFHEYRSLFMAALKKRTNKKTNTNVLMHCQGYFKKMLNKQEKEELSKLILDYRAGIVPLLSPLTLINHYLNRFPNAYLTSQVFLQPYPEKLRLRYAL
ncbi:DUF523 and DUF1722 domain-containing protein [Vibrio sp. Of7-15]|uniref:YbgA family protein n=1 Tax=Vibrio sp. Of7-15 TaxID=2724879 RepID=UPI001EF24196|nr:DUF523 and DUF1722 domain-containing protein [Vibrio sp. Of7-15]MCG7496209.1 DUF523 and DUF1722 domain-containing protein [Vibrio sp. Of7-15]